MDVDATTGFDVDAVSAWLDGVGVGHGPIDAVQLLPGGTQNLLYRFRRSGQCYVLRRPSLHPRPLAERIILREARVLGALADGAVPHPRLVALCETPDVLGVVFYVTEAVSGFNATVDLPQAFRVDAGRRHQLGLAMVDGLTALASVDPDAVGLGDFGKIEGFIERQVPRWSAQLESYGEYPDWPGPAGLGDVAGVGRWLEANAPSAIKPGLMHGDYHIGNVLFGEDGSLAAILDWELSTLGDPLLDLGRLLAAWPEPDGSGPLSLTVSPWDGFATRDELIERYAAGTGRALDDLLWFEVLACFKLAIILEGTFARASAGLADPETGRRLHGSAAALMARAEQWLAVRA